MRLALSRAVLWFFGGTIFLIVIGADRLEKMSFWEGLGNTAFLAFIVAGAIFGYTWYEYEKEEVKLKRQPSKQGEDTE